MREEESEAMVIDVGISARCQLRVDSTRFCKADPQLWHPTHRDMRMAFWTATFIIFGF